MTLRAFALVLLLALPLLAADEADTEAASFLAAKTLASAKAPSEQWIGSYAGSCWTGALRLAVVDGDKTDAGLRRIEIERITSRDKETPARELERWWIDASGAVIRGDRCEYEAGKADPVYVLEYQIQKDKLSVRVQDQPMADTADLPAAFVPDKLVALLFVPDRKGKRWRFSTLVDEKDSTTFTVEDQGKEKVAGRSGEVEARKLRIQDKDGEAFYWVSEGKIVAARWPAMADLSAAAGTEEESRTDWWTRPQDDADKAGERVLKGGLEPFVGELTYGVYDGKGKVKATVRAKLAKETQDGKPVFHYQSTTADVGSSTAVSSEEWWFAADGKLLSASYKLQEGGTGVDCKVRRDGEKLVATDSEAAAGKEELVLAAPPRLIPDAFFILKALAGEKGAYRFHGFDLPGRFAYSILVTIKDEEEIDLPSGRVKARRLELSQNVAQAHVWVDAKGMPLLVGWHDEDLNVFGPLDQVKKDLPGPVGPKSE